MAFESVALFALFIGLISALSLPLGALTTLVWTPSEKAIAYLMAFGAGALLSAVMIDLFAASISNDQFLMAAVGSIMGSLFYLYLNGLLNKQGGFYRKTATLIQYLGTQQKKHSRQLGESINRLDLFQELDEQTERELFGLFEVEHYQDNEVIFHQGDTLNHFYIIQQGTVKFRKAGLGLKVVGQLTDNDTFGHYGFLASVNSAFLAQASGDVTVWRLSRLSLNQLLSRSEKLVTVLQTHLRKNQGLVDYLQTEHELSDLEANDKIEFILHVLGRDKRLMFNREARNTFDDVVNRLNNARRFDLFETCPKYINSVFASKYKLRHAKAGETLFAHKSNADRLYLLESGSIELIDPLKRDTSNEILSPGDFFGGMAFIVGGDHISTAIAKTDVSYWFIERTDFETSLYNIPLLQERLAVYLKEHRIRNYLTQEQQLTETKAERWVKQTTKNLMPTGLPSLALINQPIYQHNAAYLAIWLGIFLDGIPESLMIGAHLADGHMISISLIAAIFIANFPEALSSSASMKEQGIAFKKIVIAWAGLMVLTGVGAALGSVFFTGASPAVLALISGLAAGAMLTVIAETMLPEAYARGGSIIGFVTLIGFLTAVSFKFLE